tara:strand:+ start:20 stop:388 length:369 start_codon:yes stop_codon:yes gene_type:complete
MYNTQKGDSFWESPFLFKEINMFVMICLYLWLLYHRPAMREKHLCFWKELFSRGASLRDMNPLTVEPIHSVNAMGLSGGRWKIQDYGDYTVIQPITSNGLNVGFPKKVKQSFVDVVNRLIKK